MHAVAPMPLEEDERGFRPLEERDAPLYDLCVGRVRVARVQHAIGRTDGLHVVDRLHERLDNGITRCAVRAPTVNGKRREAQRRSGVDVR